MSLADLSNSNRWLLFCASDMGLSQPPHFSFWNPDTILYYQYNFHSILAVVPYILEADLETHVWTQGVNFLKIHWDFTQPTWTTFCFINYIKMYARSNTSILKVPLDPLCLLCHLPWLSYWKSFQSSCHMESHPDLSTSIGASRHFRIRTHQLC